MIINKHDRLRGMTKYYLKFFLFLTAQFILDQWQTFLLLLLLLLCHHLQCQLVQGGHCDPSKQ